MRMPENLMGTESFIDVLVEGNGNWRVMFVYCNYDTNALLLLPNFDIDGEFEKNDALVGMFNCMDEEYGIIREFTKENPETPFIVQDGYFEKSMRTMNERLGKLIVDGDTTKFVEASKIFDDFLSACLNIQKGGEDAIQKAYHGTWKDFIEPK